jgi:hypothetical protein
MKNTAGTSEIIIMATGTYETIIIMATEKYDRSIWKNIGDIFICENTTGTCGKNTTGTCGNNMTGTCRNNMTGTCGKIIMATLT